MRISGLLFACTLIAATGTATAFQRSGSMPEIGTSHFHRANCHGAYDLVFAEAKKSGTVAAEDRAWAESYENAAKAKQPCPEPSAALAALFIFSNRNFTRQSELLCY